MSMIIRSMSSPINERVEILGVPVACINLAGLFERTLEWAVSPGQRTVCYANAHTLNLAYQDQRLHSALNQADLVYADGISIVWAASFLYNKRLEKMTARAWIQDFAAQAGQRQFKLYLFGGLEGVAQRAAAQLTSLGPGLQIVGSQAGIFQAHQVPGIVAQINQAQPDILMVGLGTPLQEEWLACNRQALQVPLCWAVGALFDYLAGSEKPVPSTMDRLGLEWLWRLGQDPQGKWQRYLVGNPRFFWRVWQQKRAMR